MYTARVHVTLRPSILDPQGKATQHGLQELGLSAVQSVRIGKYIVMEIDAATEAEAEAAAEQACEKLLANPVMEDYAVEVTALEKVGA
jgi:phosphoribosylformylglycinamidine synthase